MNIIGIDNGLDGGITVFKDGTLFYSKIMPTLPSGKGNGRILDRYELRQEIMSASHVFLEKAQVMKEDGKVGAGTTMLNYGFIQGLCFMSGIQLTIVPPKEWQDEMLVGFPKHPKGTSRNDRKKALKAFSAQRCAQLWPHIDWRATEHCKTPHDGKTDSALIGLYGIQHILRMK